MDTRFPTKFADVSDAPEPLRSVLEKEIPATGSVRLLIHAPQFTAETETTPATILAVTNEGWILVSETETAGAAAEKSSFPEILYLELSSILLQGELKICFAAGNQARSVTIKFETVEDEVYREAIDLILSGIDPKLAGSVDHERKEDSMLAGWPMKVRNEAQRYWPVGQKFLAAINWQATSGGEEQSSSSPQGALLITDREIVVISEESEPLLEPPPDSGSNAEAKEKFGGIITFIPCVRFKSLDIKNQPQTNLFTFHLESAHGGERLEISIPSDRQASVAKALNEILASQRPAN